MTAGDLHPDGTTGRDEEMMMKEDMPQDYFFAFKEYMGNCKKCSIGV